MDAIARIEQLEERVAVINAPFSGDTRTVKIDIAVNPTPPPIAAVSRAYWQKSKEP